MRQTWIGLSSFTYPFSCGIHPSQKPEALMTPIQLMDKALELSVTCVHFSHNMPLERCSDEDLQHIRKYAMTHGIRLENGMKHMTLERLRRCVVVSEQIGAKLLRIITDGPGYEPTVDEIDQILKEVIPVIEQSGLVLGIENHDRLMAWEYAEIAKQVNHPLVGLVVDTTNSLSTEEPVEEVLKWMAPHCVCCHLKDYTIKRSNFGIGLAIVGASVGAGRQDVQKVISYLQNHAKQDFSTILESWMEPCGTLEETLLQEEAWARDSVVYLKSLPYFA